MKVLLAFLTSVISHVYSHNLAYTIETVSVGGKDCINDCHDRRCWVSYRDQELCIPGYKKAATYYTARFKYPSITKCLSKCVFAGYDYSWCYINDDFDWDYCNPDTVDTIKLYQYTNSNGRCKDACTYRDGHDGLWCHTYWSSPSWDHCNETYYYGEHAKTIYNKKCYGDCGMHDGEKYNWCYDEDKKDQKCAPSAVRYDCPSARRKPRSPNPPRRLVSDYYRDIDNDNTLTLVTVPDPQNPVTDFTYRDIRTDLRIPYRVRSRILPQHLQGRNSRTSSAISSEARRNCRNMGMNNCLPNGNNDQLGHLVPYIVGGPPSWYNIVPQTRRINTGTTSNTDIESPSIWSVTERTVRRWVQDGGSVDYEVLVAYDLNCSTRPTGFGVIERYYTPNGALDHECSGYWYSNDPYEDPDIWND